MRCTRENVVQRYDFRYTSDGAAEGLADLHMPLDSKKGRGRVRDCKVHQETVCGDFDCKSKGSRGIWREVRCG